MLLCNRPLQTHWLKKTATYLLTILWVGNLGQIKLVVPLLALPRDIHGGAIIRWLDWGWEGQLSSLTCPDAGGGCWLVHISSSGCSRVLYIGSDFYNSMSGSCKTSWSLNSIIAKCHFRCFFFFCKSKSQGQLQCKRLENKFYMLMEEWQSRIVKGYVRVCMCVYIPFCIWNYCGIFASNLPQRLCIEFFFTSNSDQSLGWMTHLGNHCSTIFAEL